MSRNHSNFLQRLAVYFLLVSAGWEWIARCDDINLRVHVSSSNSTIVITSSQPNAIVSVPQDVNVTIECSLDPNLGFLFRGTSNDRLTPRRSSLVHKIVGVRWPRDSMMFGCKDLTANGISFTLLVKVAPNVLDWTTTIQSRDLGSTIQLNCSVYGNPMPKVWWKKSSSLIRTVSNTTDELLDGQIIPVQYNNLLIHVNGTDSYGNYSCLANNTAGLEERVFELMPPDLPHVALDSRSLTAPVITGSNGSLDCRVSGRPLPVITWQKDGQEVTDLQSHDRYVGSGSNVTRLVSRLILTNVTVSDSGYYSCFATTGPYRATQDTEVVVVGVPDIPSNVTAFNVTSSTVTVSFSVTASVDAPICKVVVWLRTVLDSWKEARGTTNGSARQVTIDDLRPFTKYETRVVSWNVVGRSGFSDIVEFETSEAEPSAPPVNVTVTPMSSTALYVEWKDPPRETWHGAGRGYYLCYQAEDTLNRRVTALNYTTNEMSNLSTIVTKLSTIVTKLQKYASYNVSVALFNRIGTGKWSVPISVRTREDVPDVSPQIQSLTTYFNHVVVHWFSISPSHTNGRLVGYMLSLWSSGMVLWNDTVSENTTMYNITSLSPGKPYEIRIAAATRLGPGPETRRAFNTPQVTEAPVTEKATTAIPGPSHSRSTSTYSTAPLTQDYSQHTPSGTTRTSSRPTPAPVEGLDVALVAGAAIAAAVVSLTFVLTVGACCFYRRRRTRKANLYSASETYFNTATEIRDRAGTFRQFEEVNPLAETSYTAEPKIPPNPKEETSTSLSATTTKLSDTDIHDCVFGGVINVDIRDTNGTGDQEETVPVVPRPPNSAEIARKRPSTSAKTDVGERPASSDSMEEKATTEYAEVPAVVSSTRKVLHDDQAKNGEGSIITFQKKRLPRPKPDYVEVLDSLNKGKKADSLRGRSDVDDGDGAYEIVSPAVSRDSRHRQHRQQSTSAGTENGVYEEVVSRAVPDVRSASTAMTGRDAEETPNGYKETNG